MRQSNAYPNKSKKRLWLSVLLTLGLTSMSLFAAAQQQSPSGAVETFEPVFDVPIEVRPRAGLYGITELMMAALEADIPTAKRLIEAGADVNETDDSQSTALMWAVHSGNIDIVNFLIAEGAIIGAKAYQGATALILAISGQHEASAVALINAGGDPNGRGNYSRNFLETAAESGMTDVIDALIRNGADLTSFGASALSYAVSRGHKDTALLLLDAGVDANSKAARSGHSVLYTASASGHVDLAKLLISRGADASEPSGRMSPLYPAVAWGHTTVVELLIDNGAVATAQHMLSAVQQGNTDTAIALMSRLDVDTFERVEIENLLAVADEPGNEEFIQLLLESDSIRSVRDDAARLIALQKLAAAKEHSRLVFAQQGEDHCVVGVWDSRSGDSSGLVSISKCPEDLFVSKDDRWVFFVDGNWIRIVSIDASATNTEVSLPDLDYRAWVDQMTLRPDLNPDYLPSNTFKPIGIGHLDDGSVGLLVSLGMPADDAYHYLLRLDDERWSMVEARWCGRGGCENPIDSLSINSTNVWNWPKSRMIWHSDISLNPFFSGQSIQAVDLEYERYQAAVHQRKFEIDGVPSMLSVFTRPSEHSDTNHTLNIDLTIDGNPPKNLSSNQCLTSIVGRFILVYEFFGGRFEVTDLGTGRIVIGDLKAALWLD